MLTPFTCSVFIDTDLTGFVLGVGLIIALALDGVEPHQNHVCDDAEAEEIAFGVVGFLVLSAVFNDLGGHVAHRAAAFVALGCDFFVKQQREAEVYDAGLVGSEVYQDVLGFQVAVNYIGCVDVSDALEDHSQQGNYDLGLDHFLFFPHRHQIFAGKVLQNNNVIIFLLEHFLEGVDVFASDQSQDPAFLYD